MRRAPQSSSLWFVVFSYIVLLQGQWAAANDSLRLPFRSTQFETISNFIGLARQSGQVTVIHLSVTGL
jgi:hypothetical protein